jgi:HEAT repeat protein
MAVELLGAVKAPGALAPLLEILKDERDPVRGTAARSLGRLGDPAAEAPLAEILGTNAHDDLKLDAAEGLLLLGTPTARARVEALKLQDAEAAEELAHLLADYGATS